MEPSPFEQARDELFQHIMRCGVVGADAEHVDEWFAETIKYMTERFPELSEQQITELKTLGLRFAQPPEVTHGNGRRLRGLIRSLHFEKRHAPMYWGRFRFSLSS